MPVLDDSRALEVVKALSDEYSRKILLAIISKPLSIEEICAESHVPVSTCYRRVRELENHGIIRPEETIITEDGKKFIRYVSRLKQATIILDSQELKVDIVPNAPGEEKLRWMWSTIKEADVPKSQT